MTNHVEPAGHAVLVQRAALVVCLAIGIKTCAGLWLFGPAMLAFSPALLLQLAGHSTELALWLPRRQALSWLAVEGMRAGARGFLLKDISLERLVDAIHRVAAGGNLFRPAITERALQAVQQAAAPFPKLALPDRLSGRETEALALMAAGFNNREIADALALSEGTVKNHVSSILSKLGVRDRTRAVLRTMELGWL
jgi:ATP/maltotriose-dependent transcriptional regulator MalT